MEMEIDGSLPVHPPVEEQSQENPDPTSTILLDRVMSIHMLANQILDYLSIKDVLTSSLVSQTWFSITRPYIQQNRKCYTLVHRSKHPCPQLSILNTLLPNSQFIPFNGLSIINCDCPHTSTTPNGIEISPNSPLPEQQQEELQEDESNFLATEVTLKYLKFVNFNCQLESPIFNFLSTVLKSQSDSIEEVSIVHIEDDLDAFHTLLADHRLPSLKRVLVLRKDVKYAGTYDPYIHDLVKAAPVLEELNVDKYGIAPPLLHVLFDTEKVHLIKNFFFLSYVYSTPENLHYSTMLSMKNPRLIKLSFAIATQVGDPFSPFMTSKLMAVLRRLLHSSRDTMKILEISHSDLVHFLHRPGGQVEMSNLPNVRQLHVWAYNDGHRQHFNGLDESVGTFPLGAINFPARFPSLESIIVYRKWHWVNRPFLEEEVAAIGADRANDLSFTCPSVTKFKFEESGDHDEEHVEIQLDLEEDIPFFNFSKTFPNVTQLHIHNGKEFNEPGFWQGLWTTWPLLEILTLTGIDDSVRNLDPDFTGMTEEDCEEMRKSKNFGKTEVKLDKLGINNLKRLKTLRMSIRHVNCKYCPVEPEGWNSKFLTGVTGHRIALMSPQLKVEISRHACSGHDGKNCMLVMSDLQPFTKILDCSWKCEMPEGWDSEYFVDSYNIDWVNRPRTFS